MVLGHCEFREGDPDYNDAPVIVGVEVSICWGLLLCKEVGVVSLVEKVTMDIEYSIPRCARTAPPPPSAPRLPQLRE